MSTVTIYVNRDQNNVFGYRVRMEDQTGTKKVELTERDFARYAGAEASHAGDEVATVKDFPAAPWFSGEFEISTGGGGRAIADFFVDGTPWLPTLKADYTASRVSSSLAPADDGKEEVS